MLVIFALALLAAVIAPFLAAEWSRRTFAGFFVEPTLVINERSGTSWTGRQAGLDYPQRVVRVGNTSITSGSQFNRILASLPPDGSIRVFTRMPDGSARLYPSIELMTFPSGDLLLFFWLPYIVGLSYLGIAGWMYRLRGRTRPGRAFVFFCICVAIACILLFDILTTYVGTVLWIWAIAGTGGALASLALRFPEEWAPVDRQPWLLGVPYLVSIGLGIWALVTLRDTAYPWAYNVARSFSYRYAVVGIVFFLAVMVYRSGRRATPTVRRQARLVLAGTLLAFAPISIWFSAPIFGVTLTFNSALLLLSLLIFPVTVAIAILRYRLLEVEVIINRTVFYGALTAILAGVFAVLITLSQRLFLTLTGEKSDAAIVITTLIIVAAFTPIRERVQKVVDRQFKELPDSTRQLRNFGEEVRSYLVLNDPEQIARSLLEQSTSSLQAESGALTLYLDGRTRAVHTVGRWRGETWLCLPLECSGERYGLLALGPRLSGERYTQQESVALQQVSDQVARALRLIIEGHRAFIPQTPVEASTLQRPPRIP